MPTLCHSKRRGCVERCSRGQWWCLGNAWRNCRIGGRKGIWGQYLKGFLNCADQIDLGKITSTEIKALEANSLKVSLLLFPRESHSLWSGPHPLWRPGCWSVLIPPPATLARCPWGAHSILLHPLLFVAFLVLKKLLVVPFKVALHDLGNCVRKVLNDYLWPRCEITDRICSMLIRSLYDIHCLAG